MKIFYVFPVIFLYIFTVASQQPEINDQYEPLKSSIVEIPDVDNKTTDGIIIRDATAILPHPKTDVQISFFQRIIDVIKATILKFFTAPKVCSVLRRIGICIVNGAMELITYYLPAPFIPLIASAAGLIIPFEPVVLLKERMPVTSYRRAFDTAVNTFMSTFNKYKMDYDDDPYMTRRFNRRLMDISGENKKDVLGKEKDTTS